MTIPPRPIRFRIWQPTHSKMLSPDDLKWGTTLSVAMGPNPHGLVLSQYTGFDADDGTPIYEGDVVDGHSSGGFEELPEDYRVVIVWDGDGGRWIARCPWSHEDWELGDYGYLERVAGNVWEHPHLVEMDDVGEEVTEGEETEEIV
jgi:hypothetical protein